MACGHSRNLCHSVNENIVALSRDHARWLFCPKKSTGENRKLRNCPRGNCKWKKKCLGAMRSPRGAPVPNRRNFDIRARAYVFKSGAKKKWSRRFLVNALHRSPFLFSFLSLSLSRFSFSTGSRAFRPRRWCQLVNGAKPRLGKRGLRKIAAIGKRIVSVVSVH